MPSDSFLMSLALAQEAALQKFGLRVVTDVTEEPITLAEAYAHLRIDSDSSGSIDDAWLEGQISAVREYCEGYLGRALAPRTMELASTSFPSVAFLLPFGPVTEVLSVTYIDTDGAEQAFEDSTGPLFELDQFVTPAQVLAVYGETWPSAQASANSVKVQYVAGYVREQDSQNDPVLPKLARSAMLILLGCAYMEREGKDYANTLDAAHALLDIVPGRERLGFA